VRISIELGGTGISTPDNFSYRSNFRFRSSFCFRSRFRSRSNFRSSFTFSFSFSFSFRFSYRSSSSYTTSGDIFYCSGSRQLNFFIVFIVECHKVHSTRTIINIVQRTNPAWPVLNMEKHARVCVYVAVCCCRISTVVRCWTLVGVVSSVQSTLATRHTAINSLLRCARKVYVYLLLNFYSLMLMTNVINYCTSAAAPANQTVTKGSLIPSRGTVHHLDPLQEAP